MSHPVSYSVIILPKPSNQRGIQRAGEAKQAKYAALRAKLNARPSKASSPINPSKPKHRHNRYAKQMAAIGHRRQEYVLYLRSAHWLLFRMSVLSTRGHQCEQCGNSERIELHHKTYERIGRELPQDVIVLCRACHRAEHGIKRLSLQRSFS